MELRETVESRGELARILFAVALAVVAAVSLRKGKRATGVLAGLGALALGYSSTTGSGELAETLDVGGSSEDAGLRCAICGEPIRPGQRRGPNENDETAHETCMQPAQ